MSDPLLPDGIKISSGKTLEERPAVCIDLGKLLQWEGMTVSIVLTVRQAKVLGSLILKQAMEIERHGLRVVSDEDGA